MGWYIAYVMILPEVLMDGFLFSPETLHELYAFILVFGRDPYRLLYVYILDIGDPYSTINISFSLDHK